MTAIGITPAQTRLPLTYRRLRAGLTRIPPAAAPVSRRLTSGAYPGASAAAPQCRSRRRSNRAARFERPCAIRSPGSRRRHGWSRGWPCRTRSRGEVGGAAFDVGDDDGVALVEQRVDRLLVCLNGLGTCLRGRSRRSATDRRPVQRVVERLVDTTLFESAPLRGTRTVVVLRRPPSASVVR